MSKLALWAAQVRAPFLLLSVVLCAIAGAAAWSDGVFDGPRLALCALGVTLAHAAVNLLNELADARSGIDARTEATPFSGGSKVLARGLLSVRAVTLAAWGALAAAAAIGAHLTAVAGAPVAVLAAAGGLVSVLYTRHLARVMLGELASGATLGTGVVVGTYYVQAGAVPGHIVLLALPPGVLTALLLLLNEFPDREADRAGGRRHIVIVLGYRGAAWVYTAALAATYAFIAAGALLDVFPRAALLALLTLPLAVKAARTALRSGSERARMVPALAANVALVLGTDLLLALAYLV